MSTPTEPWGMLADAFGLAQATVEAEIAELRKQLDHWRGEYKTLELAGQELVNQRDSFKAEAEALANALRFHSHAFMTSEFEDQCQMCVALANYRLRHPKP